MAKGGSECGPEKCPSTNEVNGVRFAYRTCTRRVRRTRLYALTCSPVF